MTRGRLQPGMTVRFTVPGGTRAVVLRELPDQRDWTKEYYLLRTVPEGREVVAEAGEVEVLP